MGVGRLQSVMVLLQAQLAWVSAWLGNAILLGVCRLAALCSGGCASRPAVRPALQAPSRSLRWSATRMALATVVSVGFTADELTNTLVSTM